MKVEQKIGIVGLGYVGLPLARLFATKYSVVGYDINTQRIIELQSAQDRTGEVDQQQLNEVLKKENTNGVGLFCTHLEKELSGCTTFVVTVPTPVDENASPDLTPLIKASEMLAVHLKKGDIIIYESTVYPGVTEEVCVPILEKNSGLAYNIDFFAGYSPERINPGDKTHTVEKILKVTSGSTPQIAEIVDTLYASVIEAGTYMAPSIKVAEAAKVIENSQRDINIAFINELAKIFNLMDLDTEEVLKAAGTKWNFLPFKPGLVGGHCIGVDPYYLAQKAIQLGYHPEIILAGRRINNGMGKYVASEVIKLMALRGIHLKDSNILVLGLTFKENCPDFRNTLVVDVINDLKEYGAQVSIYDPLVDPSEVKRAYGLDLLKGLKGKKFDAIVLTVGHDAFKILDIDSLKSEKSIVYDVKGFFGKQADGRL